MKRTQPQDPDWRPPSMVLYILYCAVAIGEAMLMAMWDRLPDSVTRPLWGVPALNLRTASALLLIGLSVYILWSLPSRRRKSRPQMPQVAMDHRDLRGILLFYWVLGVWGLLSGVVHFLMRLEAPAVTAFLQRPLLGRLTLYDERPVVPFLLGLFLLYTLLYWRSEPPGDGWRPPSLRLYAACGAVSVAEALAMVPVCAPYPAARAVVLAPWFGVPYLNLGNVVGLLHLGLTICFLLALPRRGWWRKPKS